MNRRDFLKTAAASTTVAASALAANAAGERPPRPNILWLSCEDMSPQLGCFGDAQATTPNLDQFAAQGARYTNAFSVAGVCAPSRSCLITGRYPVSLGSQHMRCKRALPPDFRCFPAYLREAGYYCTNNVKTDYNFNAPAETWDESSKDAHWRNRRNQDQPFFAVFNYTVTHESSIGKLLEENDSRGVPTVRHDPAAVQLPPYYPDTSVTREYWAHYLDLITLMDAWAGEHLRDLEKAGLAEDTVVFFFSDHGVGLPRAKRWLYDSGLHVPLIVRWPGMLKPGTEQRDLVSFVDFGPTVLSVAGIPASEMQGKAFLGAHKQPSRTHVFGARDRMDERYDLIRAARSERYKYIRNYMPERAYDQYNEYQESWPFMQELRRVQEAGQLTAEQQLWFRPTKPLEEFYDLQEDPYELNNLVTGKDRADILDQHRHALDDWMAEVGDLGLVPEMVLAAWPDPASAAYTSNYEVPGNAEASVFGRSLKSLVAQLNQGSPLQRLRAIREIGFCGAPALPVLLAALKDQQEAVLYWAAAGLGELGEAKADVLAGLVPLLSREQPCVRLSAARALLLLDRKGHALPVLLEALHHDDQYVRLYAADALQGEAGNAQVHEAFEAALKDATEYVPRIARHALGLKPDPR